MPRVWFFFGMVCLTLLSLCLFFVGPFCCFSCIRLVYSLFFWSIYCSLSIKKILSSDFIYEMTHDCIENCHLVDLWVVALFLGLGAKMVKVYLALIILFFQWIGKIAS